MFKSLTTNIFSIKNEYLADYKVKIITILGIKIRFKKKLIKKEYLINGENNKIYLRKNNKEELLESVIEGLDIVIYGSNNNIIIDEFVKFKESVIICNGSKNTIKLEQSTPVVNSHVYSYNNVKIAMYGEDNLLEIEETKYDINDTYISFGAKLNNRHLHIGKNASIGGAAINLWTHNAKIKIGDDCLFSSNINIMAGDGHMIKDKTTGKLMHTDGYCTIGNHVWLGSGVTVCKNVEIPDDSVVGTQSVVTKTFTEPNVIIAGNPAKIIKHNIEWDKDRNF